MLRPERSYPQAPSRLFLASLLLTALLGPGHGLATNEEALYVYSSRAVGDGPVTLPTRRLAGDLTITLNEHLARLASLSEHGEDLNAEQRAKVRNAT